MSSLLLNLVLAGICTTILAIYFRFTARLEWGQAIFYAIVGTAALTVVVLAIVYASYLI